MLEAIVGVSQEECSWLFCQPQQSAKFKVAGLPPEELWVARAALPCFPLFFPTVQEKQPGGREVFFRGIKVSSLKGNKFLTNYAILLCSQNEKEKKKNPNHSKLKRSSQDLSNLINPLHPIIIYLILLMQVCRRVGKRSLSGCVRGGDKDIREED